MVVHALENTRWGFESSCYVCEPSNELGLRVPFFHDDDAECVFAEFALDEHYSGAPTYVHGGVTLALVDEGMSWATIALAGKFAATRETTTSFEWPVRVGRPYRLEARIVDQSDASIATVATVLDAKGRVCVRAEARMAVLSAAQAADAVGTEVTGADARFVR